MRTTQIAGMALIAFGTLGLAYGGFSFTRETHEAELGPLSLSVDEKDYINVPIWVGVAGILIGAALLVLPRK